METPTQLFPCEFFKTKFLRAPILQKTSGRLILEISLRKIQGYFLGKFQQSFFFYLNFLYLLSFNERKKAGFPQVNRLPFNSCIDVLSTLEIHGILIYLKHKMTTALK